MSISVPVLVPSPVWGHRLRAWLSQGLRELRVRRDVHAVEGLDDALLQDIGISRAGIEDAVRHGRDTSREAMRPR